YVNYCQSSSVQPSCPLCLCGVPETKCPPQRHRGHEGYTEKGLRILPMIEVPPFTLVPSLTRTSTFAGSSKSVRELNFIKPNRSPSARLSPACFQQTIRRARMPAICLQTTVIFSPPISSPFA